MAKIQKKVKEKKPTTVSDKQAVKRLQKCLRQQSNNVLSCAILVLLSKLNKIATTEKDQIKNCTTVAEDYF